MEPLAALPGGKGAAGDGNEGVLHLLGGKGEGHLLANCRALE